MSLGFIGRRSQRETAQAWRRNFACLFALGLLAVMPAAADKATPKPKSAATNSWSVRWQPARLVNGAPVVFKVRPPVRCESLSGKWLDHEVFFTLDPASKAWFGIAGIDLKARPGIYPLTLEGSTTRGNEISFQQKITIRSAKYPSIAVTVSRKYTEPNPEQLEKISQDKTLKQELFSRVEPQREWSGEFRAPVNAPISDIFGTARTFNGKVQSRHQGLDYGVPQGTPVSALNRGTVLLARPLYFEGNCVVLDHGQGLLTLYLHLSEMKVKEGELVTRGQEVGLSGGTGRATGPHLHIAVRWQGVYLNPATLLDLKVP